MTGSAHNAEDDIAFYAASLGITHKIVVGAAPSQLPDAGGPLVPGRWLLHLADVSKNTKVWIRMGKFEKGATPLVVAADVPHFPMHVAGLVAIEVNVRQGVNDQVAAIIDGPANPPNPAANLYITLVSRDV